MIRWWHRVAIRLGARLIARDLKRKGADPTRFGTAADTLAKTARG